MNQINKLIGEIMFMGYLLNINSEYAVFVEYHGHVCSLSIKIGKDKITRYIEILVDSEIYVGINEYNTEKTIIGKLKRIKENLSAILKEKEIPFDKLPFEIEMIERYHYYL